MQKKQTENHKSYRPFEKKAFKYMMVCLKSESCVASSEDSNQTSLIWSFTVDSGLSLQL